MSRLHLGERLIVSGIGQLFVVLFGIFMRWWLFVVFLFALIPMFYRRSRPSASGLGPVVVHKLLTM